MNDTRKEKDMKSVIEKIERGLRAYGEKGHFRCVHDEDKPFTVTVYKDGEMYGIWDIDKETFVA